MKFTIENTKGKSVKVYDNVGREIRAVTKYNTETRKLTFLPTYHHKPNGSVYSFSELDKKGNSRLKRITTIWFGSYIVVDGVRY